MPVKRYDGTNWVTVAGDGIQGPAGADGTAPLSTKGQLLTRNSSAVTALSVGTNNQVLTADSAEATGLKWVTPSASADSFSVLANTSFSGVTSLTFSSISATNTMYLFLQFNDGSANSPTLRINADSGSNYRGYMAGATTSGSTDNGSGYTTNITSAVIARKWGTGGNMIIRIDGVGSSGRKAITSWYNDGQGHANSANSYNSSSTVSSFELSFGTNTGGTYILLGA